MHRKIFKKANFDMNYFLKKIKVDCGHKKHYFEKLTYELICR